MAFQTIALSTLSISAELPASNDITGYDAVTGWDVVGEVTDFSGSGDVYTVVTHLPVASRRVEKGKGSVDAQSETITFAAAITDAGQVALRAALASDAKFSFKETWQDGTIEYYQGMVTSMPNSGGNADSVRARTCEIAITTEKLEKAPA